MALDKFGRLRNDEDSIPTGKVCGSISINFTEAAASSSRRHAAEPSQD
jgi:hypothetical protein